MNRRQFCIGAGALASGFTLANLGCRHAPTRRLNPTKLLEHWLVSGSAYQCGYQSGRHFRTNIQTAFKRRRAWQKRIRAERKKLTLDDLTRALTSHVGKPYSPCRHPNQSVSGETLACARIDIGQGRWNLLEGNPCLRHERAMIWPTDQEPS